MNQGYDLTQLFSTLAQTVPIWVFVGLAVKHWVERTTKAAEQFKVSINERFESIQDDLDDRSDELTKVMAGIQASLKSIELNMATANIMQVREDIENLKEAKVRVEMKAEAALRNLDDLRSKR